MVCDDPTLPPRYVVENFRRVYTVINGREPAVRYMGNHWYSVNGETVHRVMVMEEIARLSNLMPRQPLNRMNDRSVIHRLITRLRSL